MQAYPVKLVQIALNRAMSKSRALLTATGIVLTIVLCSIFVFDLPTNHDVTGALTMKISTKSDSGIDSQQQQLEEEDERCYNVVRVKSVGKFTHRLAAFNSVLSSVRREELKRRGTVEWRPPTASKLDVVWGARDEYAQELCGYSSVRTVVLPWTANSSNSTWSSLTDTSNILLQTYYEWTADDRLCSWIETPGVIKAKYDAVHNRTCNRNVIDTARPASLEPLFLNGKPFSAGQYWPNNGNSYPAHIYTNMPQNVSYTHIQMDAVVTGVGDVIINGLKLVLYSCWHDLNPSLPSGYENAPLYDEVYVISQYWGTAVFHRMTEILPRVALHVQFLKANPQIRILGPEVGGRTGELLEIIGLNKSRLVTGTARAKIAYQPRATGCGHANVQESQMLSQLYRDYIRRTFPAQLRNRLILIRRSGSRRFTDQTEIEAVLKRAARDYNLTFAMFADNPTPSLNDTMMMFHSAVMVVAPHGAGLSNVYFSQPGTYVIEGVCNLPHVNFCYQRLVHILGHHWHGVTSRGGCEGVVDVPASIIADAARQYLRLWSSHVL